ncbi:hypothetical protein NJB14197_30180 [Mycobacterium montefiorense]|uniref:UsfY protein n=2 Tax=Mycobacterium montefiorense TaxID=154654 RepID=A0AA37PM98_9MYCO|nr:hypothetical protein MmonteBS_03560 [Mycobacterium montefiorense]GKU33984.1 hypothetical protein NJB14191_13300 [Mycobacterium montefiorense]GKU41382.1 hypothetical protein NJB14192_33660 [Mycobacterium montefiorense]GKU47480.1 hypothetical protein NJB14194_40980 [Mycobacterium montefiorense]GKU52278.1 hypothetical protein NJB14195_35220 [Mycobacterium montefiorense]
MPNTFGEESEMNYPVDYARTTRQHAGESLKNSANIPGLAAVAAAVTTLAAGLYQLAAGHVLIGVVAAIAAVAFGVAGSGRLIAAHRHVRKAELQLVAMCRNAPAPPPSS